MSLNIAFPQYYSSSIHHLLRTKQPRGLPAGHEEFRSATYIGRLRMRSHYHAFCQAGRYLGNGFGHLKAAAAEIVLEEERDIVLTRRMTEDPVEEESTCKPPNFEAICTKSSLSQAVAFGCSTDRLVELLSQTGISSHDGHESEALSAAIRAGNHAAVPRCGDDTPAPAVHTHFSIP